MTGLEVIQLGVFAGVMGAALVSSIGLIRERVRVTIENEALRLQLARLTATLRALEATDQRLAERDLNDELDRHIESADELLRDSPHVRIEGAPAGTLLAVLRFVFSRRTFEEIFSQVVIDGREEYFDALVAGKRGLARWRLAQIYVALAATVVVWASTATVQKFIKLWRLS